MKKRILRVVLTAFESFPNLRQSNKLCLGEPINEQYKKTLTCLESGDDFKNSLKMLSMLLHAEFDKRVWILVNKYEEDVSNVYKDLDIKEATKFADLYRDIFQPAFKGNEYLHKGVLTGVYRYVNSGILSGLNNLGKYSMQDFKYSQYYGVNANEMELLWDHFKESNNQRKKMKDFYNGYLEKVTNTNQYIEKYNILNVIEYLNNEDLGLPSYWDNYVSFYYIRNFSKRKEFRNKISILIGGWWRFYCFQS